MFVEPGVIVVKNIKHTVDETEDNSREKVYKPLVI